MCFGDPTACSDAQTCFRSASVLFEALILEFEGLAVLRDGANHVLGDSVWNACLNFHCDFNIGPDETCQMLENFGGNLRGITVQPRGVEFHASKEVRRLWGKSGFGCAGFNPQTSLRCRSCG